MTLALSTKGDTVIDHFGNAVLAFLQEEAAPWGRERLWRVSEYRVQPHRRTAGASQSHIPRAGNQTNSRIQVRHPLHHGAGLDGVVAVMSVTAL